MLNIKYILSMFTVFMIFSASNTFAGNAEHPKDTHYTASGFFDIHVCNWPDRAPFYMALYSTRQFKKIQSVELMNAKGEWFALLDLSRFRVISSDKKAEKRVFINQIVQPEIQTDGWFSAKITLLDGTVHIAKDFVKHNLLPIASKLQPVHRENVVDMPETLNWPAVKGASYYQIFIKDKWQEDKLIYSSKLLNKPEFVLPEDLLEYGGYYSWRVNARDVNEDIRLGDFNAGSLSAWQEFTVAD